MISTSDFLTLAHQFDRYYSQVIGQVAQKYQVSKVEIDVLLYLYNNPGHNTARDIVEFRHIAKSYVSKAVELLVQKGCLATQENQKDRRIVHLTILPQAEHIIKEARKAQDSILVTVGEGITRQEQQIMKDIMQKVSANIIKASS